MRCCCRDWEDGWPDSSRGWGSQLEGTLREETLRSGVGGLPEVPRARAGLLGFFLGGGSQSRSDQKAAPVQVAG